MIAYHVTHIANQVRRMRTQPDYPKQGARGEVDAPIEPSATGSNRATSSTGAAGELVERLSGARSR